MHHINKATLKKLFLFSFFALFVAVIISASALNPGSTTNAKADATKAIAIFAGGCFWCVESDFDKVDGVLETISGYTGGKTKNPTYKDVSYNNTGHYEAVKIIYDPSKVTYKQLVHIFWRTVDPTDNGGQFCDRGSSYRTAIFARNETQKRIAVASKQHEQTKGKLKGRIVTPVLNAAKFYNAENYHQNYYKRNKLRYSYYRSGCGRDKRIKSLWGDEAFKGLNKSSKKWF